MLQKTAEVAETYLHKGAKILLSGTLDYNQWETQDGQQRSTIQLIANRIEFIKTDGRGFEGGHHDSDDPPFLNPEGENNHGSSGKKESGNQSEAKA